MRSRLHRRTEVVLTTSAQRNMPDRAPKLALGWKPASTTWRLHDPIAKFSLNPWKL